MADYILLQENEQHEHVAAFLHAQETDLYIHRLNLTRFNKMLAGNLPEGGFKQHLAKMVQDTTSRIAEVEAILAASATDPSMPTKEQLVQAKARLDAKQAARKS